MSDRLDPFDWLAACHTCGKPHEQRHGSPVRAGTWADPSDGHAYRPRSLRADEAAAWRRLYLVEQAGGGDE